MNNLKPTQLEDLKNLYKGITPAHSADNLWESVEYRLLPHASPRRQFLPRFNYMRLTFTAVFLAMCWSIMQSESGDFFFPAKSAVSSVKQKLFHTAPVNSSQKGNRLGKSWLNPFGAYLPAADPDSLQYESVTEGTDESSLPNEPGWEDNQIFSEGAPPGQTGTPPGQLRDRNPNRQDH